MRSSVRSQLKAKKFAVHISDEPMRCPFPISCLCSTSRRAQIPSRWSPNRKLPSGEAQSYRQSCFTGPIRSGYGFALGLPIFWEFGDSCRAGLEVGTARICLRGPKLSGGKAHGPADERQLIAKQ